MHYPSLKAIQGIFSNFLYSSSSAVTSFTSVSNAIRLILNSDFSYGNIIVRAVQSPLLALNDFVSVESTPLFTNLFQKNASVSSNSGNLNWTIADGCLCFNLKANTSSQITFSSDLINNKAYSNRIVGLSCYLLTPWPLQLCIDFKWPNESTAHSLLTNLTSLFKGKLQLYFPSEIVAWANTNDFSLSIKMVVYNNYSTPYSNEFQIQLTNFTLLSTHDSTFDPYLNFSVRDSTLYGVTIFQHELNSYKKYNVDLDNVMFTTKTSVYLSLVSLNSLKIQNCMFQQSTQTASNLIDVNTFVPDGPSSQRFYKDSYQKLNGGSAQFQFLNNSYLRKNFNSTTHILIRDNLFLNNSKTLGLIMIYEQGNSSFTDHYQQVTIVNNSFLSNQVNGWLIAYLNQMRVKHVKMEGNLFAKNSLTFLSGFDPAQTYGFNYNLRNG